MTIRVFTSFSGYDSQCLALQRLAGSNGQFGYELVGWSEIDKFAIKAHNALFPQYADRNFGDMTGIDWSEVPDFDLFTYSSPCQDFSQAGKQAGGERGSGTRSSLLWECERAIAAKRPKYLLMENVAALVSKKFVKLFNQWQLTLERYGYRNFAKVLNAKDYGVPQNRERIFLVSIREDVTVEDRYGVHHVVRYEFPKPFVLEKRLRDVLESNVDEKYYLEERLLPCVLRRIDKKRTILNGMKDGTASALTAKSSPSSQTNMVGVKVLFDLQPDNKWQGSVTREQNKVISTEHIAPALNCTMDKHLWKIAEPQCEVVAMLDDPKKHDSARRIYSTGGIAPTQHTCRGGGLETKIIEIDGVYYRIHKLTPRESFRLMDVADVDIDKIQAAGISNSQQYKMAGNSIVVSCLYHIFDKMFINTEQSEPILF